MTRPTPQHTVEDIVAQVEKLSSQRPGNMQNLIEVACKSMHILEPWSAAQPQHEQAMVIIERVHGTIIMFVGALERSVEVSKKGLRISQDMVLVCDQILDDNGEPAEVEVVVAEMKPAAKEASKDAMEVTTRFHEVHKELLEITSTIPGVVVQINEEREEMIRLRDRANKHGTVAKHVKTFGNAALTTLITIGGAALPPLFILLPIAIPLVTLVADMFEKRKTQEANERETQAKNCNEAAENMKLLYDDLAELNGCVEKFSEFWDHVETLLVTLTGRIEALRKQPVAVRMKLQAIRDNWKEIGDSYITYSTKIEAICTWSKPLVRRASSSSTASTRNITDSSRPPPSRTLSSSKRRRMDTPDPENPHEKKAKINRDGLFRVNRK